MSIEVGDIYDVSLVWRANDEEWEDNCIGAKKEQGPAVMCWGVISWGIKGPFHVWDSESNTEKEQAAATIQKMNAAAKDEKYQLNKEWKASATYAELEKRELSAAARVRQDAKRLNIKAARTTHTWRGKKFQIDKITRGARSCVNSWLYVNDLCRPILWPEYKRRLVLDPELILMEDSAASHQSGYTTRERQKEGISKAP